MPDLPPGGVPREGLSGPAPPASTAGASGRFDRAGEVYFALRDLPKDQRDAALDALTAGDAQLRDLVVLLLRGADAPLRVESLADDIRAAADVAATLGKDPLQARVVTESPGDRIGSYRLLERLGEGGFGMVFAAEQLHPVRRTVALKILKLGMDSRQIVARFEAERQALALMDHPNIARVFDAGSTPTGRPYFAMELVRGEPVTTFCDRERLVLADRLALFASVCDAVQHAHAKGIIHRDIKPSNVLVSMNAGKPEPKVIDFGIAKATDRPLTEKTLFTEHRQLVGTPEYMSPEQAEGSRDIDTRTDVYSLGVLLYELVTGVTPFDPRELRSAGFGEMQRIIREVSPPRPSTRISSCAAGLETAARSRGSAPGRLSTLVKRELDWVIMKSIEKERARRYDSPGNLAADIRRHLAGHAVLAVPPSAWYLLRTFARRNKGPVAAAALLTLSLIGGLVGTAAGLATARVERAEAIGQRNRADANARDANQQRDHAQWLAYRANVAAALSALELGDRDRALSRLEACPASLRGWEWRYAHARLDLSDSVLATNIVVDLGGAPLDISCDGTRLLVPYRDRNGRAFGARVLDASSGSTLVTIDAHSAPVTSARFSPDGARLLTGSDDRTVRQWDAVTGNPLGPVITAPAEVIAARWNADTSRIAIAAGRGHLLVADSASGDLVAQSEGAGTYAAEFLSDGRVLTSRGFEPPMVWNPNELPLAAPRVVPGTSRQSRTVLPNPDARTFASISPGEIIRVYSLDSGLEIAAMRGHWTFIDAMAFSRDGKLLASGSQDNTLRIWDAASGDALRVLLGTAGPVRAAVFAPDAAHVYSLGQDGVLRCWRVSRIDDGEVLPSPLVRKFTDLAYSPAEPLLALASGHAPTSIRHAHSHALVRALGGRQDHATHVRWSADGTRLAQAHTGGALAVWDPVAGTRVLTIASLGDECAAFAFSPDASRLAASLWSGEVHLFDARSGERLAMVRAKGDRSPGLAFSSDSRILFVGRGGEPVARFEAATGAPLSGISASALGLTNVANLGRGLLAVTSYNAYADILRADSGERLVRLGPHAHSVLDAVMHPDGSRVFTISFDSTLRIWDTASGDEVAVIRTDRPYPNRLSVSADGHSVGVVFEDANAQFFHARRFNPESKPEPGLSPRPKPPARRPP